MNLMVDGMWVRQSPDRCDKCVGCNDVLAVAVQRKLSRMVVVEAEIGCPLGMIDAVSLDYGENGP